MAYQNNTIISNFQIKEQSCSHINKLNDKCLFYGSAVANVEDFQYYNNWEGSYDYWISMTYFDPMSHQDLFYAPLPFAGQALDGSHKTFEILQIFTISVTLDSLASGDDRYLYVKEGRGISFNIMTTLPEGTGHLWHFSIESKAWVEIPEPCTIIKNIDPTQYPEDAKFINGYISEPGWYAIVRPFTSQTVSASIVNAQGPAPYARVTLNGTDYLALT